MGTTQWKQFWLKKGDPIGPLNTWIQGFLNETPSTNKDIALKIVFKNWFFFSTRCPKKMFFLLDNLNILNTNCHEFQAWHSMALYSMFSFPKMMQWKLQLMWFFGRYFWNKIWLTDLKFYMIAWAWCTDYYSLLFLFIGGLIWCFSENLFLA